MFGRYGCLPTIYCGDPPSLEAVFEHCDAFRGDDRRGMSTYILSWLVHEGYQQGSLTLELLKEALKSGKFDVTTPVPCGSTAIHIMAMQARVGREALEALKLLLDFHPELVNTRNYCTETALHFVAMYGDATAARELLRRGADPTLKIYKKMDCVDLATSMRMKSGGQEVQEVLREARDAFKSKSKCGCVRPGDQRCRGCKRALYCCKEHQRKHWKAATGGHKKLCMSYKALEAEPKVPERRDIRPAMTLMY